MLQVENELGEMSGYTVKVLVKSNNDQSYKYEQ